MPKNKKSGILLLVSHTATELSCFNVPKVFKDKNKCTQSEACITNVSMLLVEDQSETKHSLTLRCSAFGFCPEISF